MNYDGVPGKNRTCDQRLRRSLLYPLSYRDTEVLYLYCLEGLVHFLNDPIRQRGQNNSSLFTPSSRLLADIFR